MKRSNGTLKSRLDNFEKQQIRHNEILLGLTEKVSGMITKMDRDFYAMPNGALHKLVGACNQIKIHWLLIFAILTIVALKQYGP